MDHLWRYKGPLGHFRTLFDSLEHLGPFDTLKTVFQSLSELERIFNQRVTFSIFKGSLEPLGTY